MKSLVGLGLILVTLLLPKNVLCQEESANWKHLSNTTGELPQPNGGTQQTACVVADIDGDGRNDIVLSERTQAPSIIWLRNTGKGWSKYVIDDTQQRPEAGGCFHDIDGDGHPDLVIGSDSQNNELWWYENPAPNFEPKTPWKKHLIFKGGGNQRHDQAWWDYRGDGKPGLVFWDQGAKKLMLADVPENPRTAQSWPVREIWSYAQNSGAINGGMNEEGMSVADIDGDGKPDLLAGNYWFKYTSDGKFIATKVAPTGGRIYAGKFKPGKIPEIVIAPGDGSGPLMFYECSGDPLDPNAWKGRDLLGVQVIHGHSLQIGDINKDGNLDIFVGEMAKWTESRPDPDNPKARSWILYGDGKGGFRTTLFTTGIEFHEARLVDVNGDGWLDIVSKPYNWETPRLDIWINPGKHGSALKPNAGASFSGPLGMELWTYRNQLSRDLPGTLAVIRSLGFTDVETASFYGRSADAFKQELNRAGLTCSSLIVQYDQLVNDLRGVARDAKTLGCHYVITPGFPHQQPTTADDVHKAATAFNQFGAALKQEGLQFGYHPHGFEFVPNGGGTLFDVLLNETDRGAVTYELDVFWCARGGADPARYLTSYPDRFMLIHLKDLKKGAQVGDLSGSAPEDTSVVLGTGQLDFPAILKAAKQDRVKDYYIEDEAATAPDQVPASQEFLKTVRF